MQEIGLKQHMNSIEEQIEKIFRENSEFRPWDDILNIPERS